LIKTRKNSTVSKCAINRQGRRHRR